MAKKTSPGWLTRIATRTGAKYTALADTIAGAIESGSLAEGHRLPPHREIATRADVTIATVTKAIAELTRRGLVASRRGSGTFVRAAGTAGEPETGLRDLAVNRPPVGPVAKSLAEALAAVNAERGDLFGYEPVGGSTAHRQAGALWLAERGLVLPADQILVTEGANDGLLTALAAIAGPKETVLCEEVNYAGLRRIAELLGLSLVGVAVDRRGMVPGALRDACRKHRPRAVVCTPVTHNPTGATCDAERRRELARVLEHEDVVAIEDDINGHLGTADAGTLFALAPARTIYVTSLSKCISAGLRVGFVAAAPAMISRLRDALYSRTWTAPTLHAAVARRLIVTGAARQCVADQRAEAKARMAIARRHLGSRIAADAGPAFHVWVALERAARAVELDLLKENILVSPADHFAVPGRRSPNAIRIGLGGVAARADLEAALRIVGARITAPGKTLGAIS
jgi:DNA-binding transcriptional MocR family regulator